MNPRCCRFVGIQSWNPYVTSPYVWHLQHPDYYPYYRLIGGAWKNVASVYGPFATAIQRFAASIGETLRCRCAMPALRGRLLRVPGTISIAGSSIACRISP